MRQRVSNFFYNARGCRRLPSVPALLAEIPPPKGVGRKRLAAGRRHTLSSHEQRSPQEAPQDFLGSLKESLCTLGMCVSIDGTSA